MYTDREDGSDRNVSQHNRKLTQHCVPERAAATWVEVESRESGRDSSSQDQAHSMKTTCKHDLEENVSTSTEERAT